MTSIDTRMLDRELKKGSAELILLSIVDSRSLTAEGCRVLTRQRATWKTFVHAIGLITGVDHA